MQDQIEPIHLNLGDLLEVCYVNTDSSLWVYSIDNNSGNCLTAQGEPVLQDIDPSVYGGNVYCQIYESVCVTAQGELSASVSDPANAINLVFENVYYTVNSDGGITTGEPTTSVVFLVTVD